MSLSATSTAVPPTPVTPTTRAALPSAPPAQTTAAAAGRSADGDYKVRSAMTSQVKDADGDYKPVANAAAATSSNAVMAAVTALTKGG